jgi:hypothetical protein
MRLRKHISYNPWDTENQTELFSYMQFVIKERQNKSKGFSFQLEISI